jgi:hypothetical protein
VGLLFAAIQHLNIRNKNYFMSKKVTFKLGKHIVGNATGGVLVGDFNNWNTDLGFELTQAADGSLTATIELQAGQAYQYRYLLNDGRWENDDTAPHYASTHGLHVENCVVIVDEVTSSAPTKEPVKATKKAAPVKKDSPEKKASPKKATTQEDFSEIEGISKPIAAILVKNSIDTYSKLSKTSVKKLTEILKEAGGKFESVDAAKWPKDAKTVATTKAAASK